MGAGTTGALSCASFGIEPGGSTHCPAAWGKRVGQTGGECWAGEQPTSSCVVWDESLEVQGPRVSRQQERERAGPVLPVRVKDPSVATVGKHTVTCHWTFPVHISVLCSQSFPSWQDAVHKLQI